MKMFINMTKPSPVMAALAEMQGKSFVLSSNQLENVVYQKNLVYFYGQSDATRKDALYL